MAHHDGHSITVKDPGTFGSAIGHADSIPLFVGLIGILLAGAVAYLGGSLDRFYFSYLHNLVFMLSIALGALFFVFIQHITRAGWSVVVRRLAEIMTTGFTTLAILFLPVLIMVLIFKDDTLFLWNNAAKSSVDPLIKDKMIYLHPTWFSVRALCYFAFWILSSRLYLALSAKQDETGDPAITLRMERYSAVCLILFALSITFAAVDWIMSLDPHWFSTMIGVSYFSTANVSFYATLAIVIFIANKSGYLNDSISVEHRHDVGKLLFGFNCFWAYIAFSPYLLYWYANIPEETVWYARRQENGWEAISMLLILGHFVIPFLGLMSRTVKRNPLHLFLWAVFLLIMSWFDLYWFIMPEVSPSSPALGLIDILCLLGVGGLTIHGVLRMSKKYRLLAIKDPRLPESLAFHNI